MTHKGKLLARMALAGTASVLAGIVATSGASAACAFSAAAP